MQTQDMQIEDIDPNSTIRAEDRVRFLKDYFQFAAEYAAANPGADMPAGVQVLEAFWAAVEAAGFCGYCDSGYVGLYEDSWPVPPVGDAQWAEMAGRHEAGCEWIATQAHRVVRG